MRNVNDLKCLARKLTGTLCIEVEYLGMDVPVQSKLRGWYWRDLNENPRDQWRGPFKDEAAAWVDAIETYGVDPDAKPPAPEDPVRVALVAIVELCGPFIDLQCEPVGTLERIAHLAHKALEELP